MIEKAPIHFHFESLSPVDGKMSVENAETKARTGSPVAMDITLLIDDCLLEIFSYLSDMDLCAVKNSHPRFEQLTDDAFKAKFITPSPQRYVIDDNRKFSENVKVFENFGHMFASTAFVFKGNNDLRKVRYKWLLKMCNIPFNTIYDYKF